MHHMQVKIEEFAKIQHNGQSLQFPAGSSATEMLKAVRSQYGDGIVIEKFNNCVLLPFQGTVAGGEYIFSPSPCKSAALFSLHLPHRTRCLAATHRPPLSAPRAPLSSGPR
jgi:hypothetical protein